MDNTNIYTHVNKNIFKRASWFFLMILCFLNLVRIQVQLWYANK